MNLFQNLIQGSISTELINLISSKTGIEKTKLSSIIAVAIPLILKQINSNVSTPNGAAKLESALKKHDGSVLDNLPNITLENLTQDGSKILSHVFGDNLINTTNKIAASTGTNHTDVSNILSIVSPMVMGAIGKEKSSNNQTDIITMLSNIVSSDIIQNPLVNKLLDQDGDGHIEASDLLGLAMGAFGKK